MGKKYHSYYKKSGRLLSHYIAIKKEGQVEVKKGCQFSLGKYCIL